MDKTLSIIFVATVLLITAVTLTVFFTTSLDDTVDDLDRLQSEEGPDWLSHDTEYRDHVNPVNTASSEKGGNVWIRA